MPRRRSHPLPWVLLVLLAGAWLPAAVEADAPEGKPTEAQVALARLASPLLVARRGAVHQLVRLLPGSRPAVVAALPGAPWQVQLQLIEILSRDGSPEAVDALVRHLGRTDETQAQRIRVSLARDPAARDRLLAAWRQDAEGFARAVGERVARQRVDHLIALLRRAEIEARFVARKSKSGSTGYYRGQYEHLRGEDGRPGYRKLALEVVTGIALDEAMPTPGLYRSGVYRFLHEHFIDEWELRSMALNAVGELCTPEDGLIVERLEQNRVRLRTKWIRLEERLREASDAFAWNSKEFQDAYTDWEDCVGEYLDQVACLYQIVPERYDAKVEQLIDDIEDPPLYDLRRKYSYIAGLLIRVGWYERAVDAYQRAMFRGSTALGYYNQACAFAQWSKKTGLSARARTSKLDLAMHCLEAAVSSGWSDVAWMNEDRDLDPLREHRKERYDVLVKRIRASLALPPK